MAGDKFAQAADRSGKNRPPGGDGPVRDETSESRGREGGGQGRGTRGGRGLADGVSLFVCLSVCVAGVLGGKWPGDLQLAAGNPRQTLGKLKGRRARGAVRRSTPTQTNGPGRPEGEGGGEGGGMWGGGG